MGPAARSSSQGPFRVLALRVGWAALAVHAFLACSIYQPELLDDAATGIGSGSGGGGRDGGAGAQAMGASTSIGGGSGSGKTGGSSSGGTSEPTDGGEGGSAEDAGGSPSAAGTSNEPGAGAGSGTGGSSAGGAPGGDLLDGFEDEDLVLEQSQGRGGVWYLFADGTVGKAGPLPLVCSPLADAPEALGGYAMHITATGFTDWGSGLGVDFIAGKKPYDASARSGIRFWARVGAGKNTRHRLQLVDASTEKLGGICNPAPTAPDGEKCEDHFGKNLVLTSTWTQYVIPFTELSQIGWGKPAAALDAGALYGLQLTAKAKLDVDLWLDQVELY